jgi:hypothetical protein
MANNPFGDEGGAGRRPNPFGEDEGLDPMRRLEGAPARLRGLRGRVGAEGMTGLDMRQLLDELAADIEAITQLLAERKD